MCKYAESGKTIKCLLFKVSALTSAAVFAYSIKLNGTECLSSVVNSAASYYNFIPVP